jgi:SM-20-related protein
VLDLHALTSTSLETEPFQWSRVAAAIPHHDAEELVTTFPDDGFWEITGNDGEKSFTYAARPLVTLGARRPAPVGKLASAWESVAAVLVSDAYRGALSEHLGRSLDGASMEASIWRWDADAHLGPHLDLPSKIVTQVFYFNDLGWDPSWGGCLRILRSRDADDAHAEIPPALGSASVLVRSECSWHSVTPVAATAPQARRSLIITWFHPGSTSPVWAVDEHGDVSCPVGRRLYEQRG